MKLCAKESANIVLGRTVYKFSSWQFFFASKMIIEISFFTLLAQFWRWNGYEWKTIVRELKINTYEYKVPKTEICFNFVKKYEAQEKSRISLLALSK